MGRNYPYNGVVIHRPRNGAEYIWGYCENGRQYLRGNCFDDKELIEKINDTPFDIEEQKYYGKRSKPDLDETQGTQKRHPRNERVAINALSNAKCQCEYDTDHATFQRRKPPYLPYTEPHHLIPLSLRAYHDFEASLDVEENICSLCSTCHNCLHYGKSDERDKILEALYNKRKIYLAKAGLEITFDNLKKYY